LDEESAERSRPRQALANLRNHREAIAAMDFFTVQTITFGVLQCFSRTARFGPWQSAGRDLHPVFQTFNQI